MKNGWIKCYKDRKEHYRHTLDCQHCTEKNCQYYQKPPQRHSTKKGKISKQEAALDAYKYLDEMPLEGLLWEFIRRNTGVRDAYSESQTAWSQELNAKYFPLYGILYAINPSIKYGDNETQDKIIKAGFKMQKPFRAFLPQYRSPIYEESWKSFQELNPDAIRIMFDPSLSERFILKSVTNIIRRAKEHIEPKKNLRLRDEWKQYIIAYDLKDKEGYSIKKIAQILFPHETHNPYGRGCHPDCSPCRKIRNYIQKAKELINNGFQAYLTKTEE